MFVNEAVPFPPGAEQKEATENNRERPQSKECRAILAFKRSAGEVNRDTAGQQADREKDRSLQYFSRSRSRHAFSHVEEISDHKNREDGRLRNDETGHRDLTPVRKSPSLRDFA